MGILLSGVLTQWAGLYGCLWGLGVMLAICAALTLTLPTEDEARQAMV